METSYAVPPAVPLRLLGLPFHPMEQRDLTALMEDSIGRRRQAVIFNHNLHSLYLCQRQPVFRAAYDEATSVYLDGQLVVWLARMLRLPVRGRHRLTFVDQFEPLLDEAASRGWRVFYLGASDATVRKGLAALRERLPALVIEGHHGYFPREGAGEQAVLDHINAWAPDVLFVGMGMPVQELWLARTHRQLQAPVILTCGATLQYVTGDSPKPPAWLGPLGLYGAFRLIREPRRLWRRYLLEPVVLLRYILPELLRRWSTAEQLRPSPGDPA